MGCNAESYPPDERSPTPFLRCSRDLTRPPRGDERTRTDAATPLSPWTRTKNAAPKGGVLLVSQCGTEDLDGFDPLDLRDLLTDDTLDAIRERKLRHRASTAGALQGYLHNTVFCDLHKLDIAAIGLQRRPDLVECCLNAFLHRTLLPRDSRGGPAFTLSPRRSASVRNDVPGDSSRSRAVFRANAHRSSARTRTTAETGRAVGCVQRRPTLPRTTPQYHRRWRA